MPDGPCYHRIYTHFADVFLAMIGISSPLWYDWLHAHNDVAATFTTWATALLIPFSVIRAVEWAWRRVSRWWKS